MLQARVADDLRRTNLADVIQRTLIEAIEYYQPDIFVQDQAYSQWTSTVGFTNMAAQNNLVPLPPQFEQMDELQLTYSGAIYKVVKRTINYINAEDAQIPPIIGPPIDWCYFLNGSPPGPQTPMLRLWPWPDIVYPLTATYRTIIPVPATDDTSNFWTTDAESLIRHRCEAVMRATIVKSADLGAADLMIAKQEFSRLKRRVSDLECTNRVKPVYF
jgi:hypothetical protein